MTATPVVIKLGGSLAVPRAPSGEELTVGTSASPAAAEPLTHVHTRQEGGSAPLSRWLGVIAEAVRPVVVVPGGGAFADTVRSEQKRLGFSDEAAHFMAILAMHQTGTMLLDMQPRRLVPASTEAELRGALGRGDIPVWMALGMVIADPHLPRDWSVTSDGLAAWLALQLRIPEVWLVKSRTVAAEPTLSALASEGVVDPVFADLAGRAGLSWRVFGPGQEQALLGALAAPAGSVPDA